MLVPPTKCCSGCKEKKSFSDFWKNKNRKDGYCNECKKCLTKRQQEPQNKKRKQKYTKEYQKRPKVKERLRKLSKKPKYKETVKKGQLRRKFGLTLDEYYKMIQQQKGLCIICKFPEIVVDHNHKTNKVRGLICQRCNKILGFAQDDINLLQGCINYLKDNNVNTTNTK